MAMDKKGLKDFYITPRRIGRDLRSGKLTPDEWKVFMYIRQYGNPYGSADISLEDIRNDLYKGTKRPSINYLNGVVLSLKSKRYIYYEERRGRRGSFEVHLDYWVRPDGTIKTLDVFFGRGGVRGEDAGEARTQSEDKQNLNPPSQTLEEQKETILKHFSLDCFDAPVRGANNDTDIDKENYKYVNRSKMPLKEERLTTVVAFNPGNSNEQRCRDIANELGEKHINPILAVLRKHGIGVIEEAWGIVREDLRNKGIRNKRAYFQGIVKQILLQNS